MNKALAIRGIGELGRGLTTVVSYPDRGNYGDNKWRGNCSGELIKDLLEYAQPKKAFDPMVGSGTFIDVCRELGINHFALDLNPLYGGWDALNDEIPESYDFAFWHPPYWKMIPYSGNVWGDAPDPRDLSHVPTWGEFIQKMNQIHEKLIYGLRRGGRLAILVGDMKKCGKLYSMMKDMAWYGNPENVLIKIQHNADSYKKKYAGTKLIPIVHEYVLLFKREDCYIIPQRVTQLVEVDIRTKKEQTWRDVVHAAMEALDGKATLKQLYQEIAGHKKCENNPNWPAKVRQILQLCKDFVNLGPGVWGFAY